VKKAVNGIVPNILMNHLTADDLQSGKVRAYAENKLSGEIQELTTRPERICHFFKPFEYGGYIVQLRLDWKDHDSQGNPMLDADFLDPITHKNVKSMKAHQAHHTPAQNSGERAYIWKFEDNSMKLVVRITWSMYLNSETNLIDTVLCTLTRAGEEIP
jgi:hypothetical protein